MRLPRFLVPALTLVGFVALSEVLRRRRPQQFEPVVRCSRGHLYRSIWVPGGSLKAVRWFDRRFQWCPVGHHFSWTRRVDAGQLTAEELAAAAAVHDLRIA